MPDHRAGGGRFRREVVLQVAYGPSVVNRLDDPAHHAHAGRKGAGGEQTGDVLERSDREQRLGLRVGQVADGQSRTGHDGCVDERARDLGAPFGVAVDGAHAHEIDVTVPRRAEQGDGVVRVRADVGVDPEPHAAPPRALDGRSGSGPRRGVLGALVAP